MKSSAFHQIFSILAGHGRPFPVPLAGNAIGAIGPIGPIGRTGPMGCDGRYMVVGPAPGEIRFQWGKSRGNGGFHEDFSKHSPKK